MRESLLPASVPKLSIHAPLKRTATAPPSIFTTIPKSPCLQRGSSYGPVPKSPIPHSLRISQNANNHSPTHSMNPTGHRSPISSLPSSPASLGRPRIYSAPAASPPSTKKFSEVEIMKPDRSPMPGRRRVSPMSRSSSPMPGNYRGSQGSSPSSPINRSRSNSFTNSPALSMIMSIDPNDDPEGLPRQELLRRISSNPVTSPRSSPRPSPRPGRRITIGEGPPLSPQTIPSRRISTGEYSGVHRLSVTSLPHGCRAPVLPQHVAVSEDIMGSSLTENNQDVSMIYHCLICTVYSIQF